MCFRFSQVLQSAIDNLVVDYLEQRNDLLRNISEASTARSFLLLSPSSRRKSDQIDTVGSHL